MSILKKMVFTSALMVSFSAPSHAFLTELVVGITSVTNNLIDSTESVTNNTMNNATSTMQSLSSNPGKMADRIGLMADRIGFMADRIVTTEGIMAGLAHKIIDSGPSPQVRQFAAGYVPANSTAYAPAYVPVSAALVNYQHTYAVAQPGNAYSYSRQTPVAPVHARSDNSHYSASYMIYGNTGSTYTAARPATAATPVSNSYLSAQAYAQPPAVKAVAQSCGISYGVTRRC
jgi:hypothetical protein